MSTTLTQPTVEVANDQDYIDALRGVFSAEKTYKALRKEENKRHKDALGIIEENYSGKLERLLPLVYEWSATTDVESMCLRAGIPVTSEQSVRYYLRGGKIASEFVRDETSLVTVMTHVNWASQENKDITIKQIDAIIGALLARDTKPTWGDFVEAVKAATPEVTAATRHLRGLLKNSDDLTSDEWDVLALLVRNHEAASTDA